MCEKVSGLGRESMKDSIVSTTRDPPYQRRLKDWVINPDHQVE
jgi:hypothetical protein